MLYTIGNIMPKIASFILVPIYSRFLTPSDYGITSSMSVLTTILGIIFTLAVERSINRLYFDYHTEKEKKEFLGTVNYSILILSSVILALLFLFNSFVEKIYTSIPFNPYYMYAVLAAFFNILVTVPSMYYRVEEKAKTFVALSLLRFIAATAFTLVLVVWLKEGAEGYLKAGFLAALFVLPVYAFITIKITSPVIKPKLLVSSLKFSLPMIPVMISAWVLNLSDRIFIERYQNLSEVGIYSIGYSVAGFVLLFTSSFYMAYSPHFYKVANIHKTDEAKSELSSTNNIYIVAAMVLCFIVSLYAKEIVELLFDKRYHGAYIYVPIISLAYFFQQINGINHLMFYQEKRSGVVMYIITFCAALNILLNYLFVPVIGAYGAAIATLIAIFIQFIISYVVSRKYYFIPFKWKVITPLFLGGVLIYFFFNYLRLDFVESLVFKTILISILTTTFVNKYFHSIKKLVMTG